jgi:hypothetical protein
MAIHPKIRGRLTALTYALTQTFVCLLGLGAIAWGAFLFPLFWQQAQDNRVASEILKGRAFKFQSLLDEARHVAAAEQTSYCNATLLHDAFVVRFAALDRAIVTANQAHIESAYAPLYDATRTALACSPADAFEWLTLFWLEVGKHGYEPDYADYLRMSYALGPNEGWIALWRSRLALALFERLPADLSNDAIEDFINLLDTGQLYPQTVAIFAAATPEAQSRIVDRLKSASAIPRQAFARMLYDKGVEVAIPGTDARPTRPWW